MLKTACNFALTIIYFVDTLFLKIVRASYLRLGKISDMLFDRSLSVAAAIFIGV